MPLRDLTPEEAAHLQSQGIDPSTIKIDTDLENAPEPTQDISQSDTIKRQLIAHGGGLLGGSAAIPGAIYGASIGAFGGPLDPVTIPAGAIIGGTIAGLGGSYVGQSAQQALTPDDMYAQQQQAAQESAQANPKTAFATDLIAGALASGGRPSRDILRAGEGLIGKIGGQELTPEAKQALINTLTQSAVNPAISTGVSLAQGQGIPSVNDLLGQAAGGAIFSKSWVPHGRPNVMGEPELKVPLPDATTKYEEPAPLKMAADEPIQEVNNNPISQTVDAVKPAETPIVEPPNKVSQDEELGDKVAIPETNETELDLQKQLAESGDVQSALPPDKRPTYIGKQENFTDPSNPIHLYNLKEPITDADGKVVSGVGSTVSKGTLEKYGIPHDEPTPKVNAPIDGTGDIKIPIALQADIRNNNSTTGSILHSLATTPGHPFQPLAKALLDIAIDDKDSLGVKWNHNKLLDNGSERSHYNQQTDQVNIGTQSAGDARVVMEEVVHSLTAKKIPNFAGQGEEHYNRLNSYLSKPDANPHVKDLIEAYFDVAKHLNVHDSLFKDLSVFNKTPTELNNNVRQVYNPDSNLLLGLANNPDVAVKSKMPLGHTTKYALGNLHEFIAQAIKDPDFQKVLNGIKTTDGRTVMQKIVDSVRNLLGLKGEAGTMLDRVLRSSGELVKQERPGDANALKLKSGGYHYSLPKEEPKLPATSDIKDPEIEQSKSLKLTRSMIDSIASIPHATARYLAGAFKKALNEQQQLRGKWTNSILTAGKKLTEGDKAMLNKVADYENMNHKSGMFMLKTDASRQAYLAERAAHNDSAKLQLKYGIPVYDGGNPRMMKPDPFHHAFTMEPKVVQTLKTGTDIKAIEQYHQDFVKNATENYNRSPAAAEKLWNELRANVTGKSSNSAPNMEHFAGSRVAQGIPMPESMRRSDWLRNQEVYYNRLALNHAYYHHVESDPKVLGALGETKDAWNEEVKPDANGSLADNDSVRSQLNQFHGEKGGALMHNEEAISAMATGMAIASPGLEVHKIISNVVGAVSVADNPIQMVKMLTSAVKNFREGYTHSVEQGQTKLTAKTISQMFNRNATFAERLQGLAAGVRKLSTLGGVTTQFNDGLMQAAMEYIIPFKIDKAATGDKTAQQFMQKLDPDYVKGKQYTPEEVKTRAAQAVGYIHGTNDGRSMPAWMSGDSEVSGFFKLAHWSISQTNRFMSDVYTPATNGNYTPLVMSIFGSVVGGYMIKEMREKLQGKKYQLPDLQDISASDRGLSGNAGLLAYNAIAACQYAGFGGILSQVARYPFDVAYKSKPQGAMFPLDEIATDLAQTISQVATAATNDPHFNWLDGAKAVTEHILSSDFSLARMAVNQGINHGLIDGLPAEKKELSDKMMNLRKFNMAEGLPYNDIEEGSNPYENIEQKKFHMEQDPGKAIGQLPNLINTIITKYQSTPDVMMAKIKALKDSSYPTMPNMETYPLEFFKYIKYLDNQEAGKGKEFLQDYLQHKMINSVKSSVVP